MTVTLSATLTVGLRPLRQALAAVIPHAEPTKTGDEVNAQARVRLVAAKGELFVMATCTATSALAAVTIDQDDRKVKFAVDDGPLTVDLQPRALRGVLQQFKAARKGSDDGKTGFAELVLTQDTVVLTDVSALFPGLSLTVPTLGLSTEFPDVYAILGRSLASSSGKPGAKPLVSQGKAVALFAAASKAYGEPLEFEATGTAESRGFTVLCGPSFIGLVSSRHNDDDSLKRRDLNRHQHIRRLGLDKPLHAAG